MTSESRSPRPSKKTAAPSAPIASPASSASGSPSASTSASPPAPSTPGGGSRKSPRTRRNAGRACGGGAALGGGAPPSCPGETLVPSVEGTSVPETPARLALDLLRAGESELRVRAVLTHRHLSTPVIDDAIEQAYALMRGSWTARGAREKMALALEQRARIVAEAMASSDWRVALAAMEQREKLLGLTGPDALEQAATNLLDLLRLATDTGNLTDAIA